MSARNRNRWLHAKHSLTHAIIPRKPSSSFCPDFTI
jgi:hypothetical protein